MFNSFNSIEAHRETIEARDHRRKNTISYSECQARMKYQSLGKTTFMMAIIVTAILYFFS